VAIARAQRVPSPSHEFLVDLFRTCGDLAPELLELCANIAFCRDHVEHTSIDLSQAVSTEYRADGVVELRDRDNNVVAAVIIEVQLHVDADKKLSWPVYICALRAKLHCPVLLLVLTRERHIARWARKPIELGHPGFRLAPLVIDFEDVPRIVNPVHARRIPQLAVLSVLAHPDLDVAETAMEAIGPLPSSQGELYSDIILASVPEAVRKLLEARFMQGYQLQSEFARRQINEASEAAREAGRAEGREAGRVEGREAGRVEGREAGRVEGLRSAVLTLARSRFDAVTDDDVAALAKLRDEDMLNELIVALGRPGTATEARAMFERVLRRGE
jgi:hypothetical protein